MTWFSDWAMKHCVAFGFQGQHAETVLAWEAAFTLLFSDAELYEATATLVSRVDTKSFPGDQRGQIIAAIETTRAKRRGREEPASNSCRSCSGSGWVSVPHPGLDENGHRFAYLRSPREDLRGLTRTMGVCCTDCNKGQRTRADSESRNKPALTFDEYCELYPDWEMIQAERNAVVRAESEPSTITDVAAFRAEIVKRYRMPKETTTHTRN